MSGPHFTRFYKRLEVLISEATKRTALYDTQIEPHLLEAIKSGVKHGYWSLPGKKDDDMTDGVPAEIPGQEIPGQGIPGQGRRKGGRGSANAKALALAKRIDAARQVVKELNVSEDVMRDLRAITAAELLMLRLGASNSKTRLLALHAIHTLFVRSAAFRGWWLDSTHLSDLITFTTGLKLESTSEGMKRRDDVWVSLTRSRLIPFQRDYSAAYHRHALETGLGTCSEYIALTAQYLDPTQPSSSTEVSRYPLPSPQSCALQLEAKAMLIIGGWTKEFKQDIPPAHALLTKLLTSVRETKALPSVLSLPFPTLVERQRERLAQQRSKTVKAAIAELVECLDELEVKEEEMRQGLKLYAEAILFLKEKSSGNVRGVKSGVLKEGLALARDVVEGVIGESLRDAKIVDLSVMDDEDDEAKRDGAREEMDESEEWKEDRLGYGDETESTRVGGIPPISAWSVFSDSESQRRTEVLCSIANRALNVWMPWLNKAKVANHLQDWEQINPSPSPAIAHQRRLRCEELLAKATAWSNLFQLYVSIRTNYPLIFPPLFLLLPLRYVNATYQPSSSYRVPLPLSLSHLSI